ncbi:MAG: hypothetical protein PSU93_09280 [Methylobacter sp.]|uniref:Uncharacterized protein n=1 Tax=Candidatus Methylobacter titanis TaxID=3053457 RepID=A0AA43Q687_9GAMM|nr:hypothetical protein [Candidatus Methylobacter titanis]
MASGKLGTADLVATTLTTIYTVPALKVASYSISVCNRTNASIALRLAESVDATPGLSEYIEYDMSIPANGVLERTGRVLDAGKLIVAYASATGISININGYEE